MSIETGMLIVTLLTKFLILVGVGITVYWFFSMLRRTNKKAKENVVLQDKLEGNLKKIYEDLDSIGKSLDVMIQTSVRLKNIRSVNQRWIDEYNRQQSVQAQTKTDEVPYSPVSYKTDAGLGTVSTKVPKE